MLKGFGSKTQDMILKGLEYYKKHKGKKLFFEVELIANDFKQTVSKINGVCYVEFAGSLRRKKEIVKDIDLILLIDNVNTLENIRMYFAESGIEVIEFGDKFLRCLFRNINVDIRIANAENFVTMLHHFTGSKEHNEVLRMKAKEKGFKINEYGIFRGAEKINIKSEKDIYELLDLPYIIPELREGYYEFSGIDISEEKLVNLSDIRGVFHVHTVDSDGLLKLEDLKVVADKFGYEYIGISDHSKSSYIANGLDEKRALLQLEKIEMFNSENNTCFLKGIECDILADGSLDFSDELLSKYDFVIASVHSHFNLSKSEMTRRLIKALSSKYVTMFGHPTGRLLLSREGYHFDEDEVYKVCRDNGVIVELNTNPYRLDIDWRKMEYVHKYNLKVSINPDAHGIDGFNDLKYGVNIARKGALHKNMVLNSYNYEDIVKYIKK